MSKFVAKVYIVQQADARGNLFGPVIAAKLTFLAAHEIAKKFAPAKVTTIIADKTNLPNNPEHPVGNHDCN